MWVILLRGSGPSQLHPHGPPRHNAICLVGRQNSRIQVFDAEGRFKREWLGQGQRSRVVSSSTSAADMSRRFVRRETIKTPAPPV